MSVLFGLFLIGLGVAFFSGFFAAPFYPFYYRPFFFPFGFIFAFFWIFIIFSVFRWLFWGWGWGWHRRYWSYDRSYEILRERYARGEITKEQYDQMLRDLQEHRV